MHDVVVLGTVFYVIAEVAIDGRSIECLLRALTVQDERLSNRALEELLRATRIEYKVFDALQTERHQILVGELVTIAVVGRE